jgi:hypothetical protein
MPLGHSGAEVACRSWQVARVIWYVSGRLQVRARYACNNPSSGCPYIPFFFNMITVAGGATNAMGVS